MAVNSLRHHLLKSFYEPLQNLRYMSNSTPHIEATPRACLYDVPTHIKVQGLRPNSKYTIGAEMVEDRGKQFCSNAHYTSDCNGEIDLYKNSSSGGSYEGVFAHGLLTTLAPGPKEYPHIKPLLKDITKPCDIEIYVQEGYQCLDSHSPSVATINLERHFMEPGVKRVPIRQGKVRGVLFLPPGEGPHPGVVDMFGAARDINETRSALTASRGIASLALPYFNYDDLPKTSEISNLEYFEEAVEILTSYPSVIPDRCGVISICQGGMNAVVMGVNLEKVKAVVGISTPIAAIFSEIKHKGKTLVPRFDALYEANDNEESAVGINTTNENDVLAYVPSNKISDEYSDIDEDCRIPLENASEDTWFYFAYGKDDPYEFYKTVKNYQAKFGKKSNHVIEQYDGTGHIIDPPYTPFCGFSYLNMGDGITILMAWGGNPKSTCETQEQLWPKTLSFIKQHIQHESIWFQQWLSNYISER